MSDERRKDQRYLAWIPVRMGDDDDGRVVLSRNLSQRGLLLTGPERLAVGMPVTLEFKVLGETRRIQGTIVRTTEGEDDMYPYRMGVEFDDPVPELQALLEDAVSRG